MLPGCVLPLLSLTRVNLVLLAAPTTFLDPKAIPLTFSRSDITCTALSQRPPAPGETGEPQRPAAAQ